MSYGGSTAITGLNLTTLEVDFNDSFITPGFIITLTGLIGYDKFRIVLKDPEGNYPDQTVRGTDLVSVTGDTFLVVDYEFPNFRTQTYVLELYKSGVKITAGQVTVSNLPRDYFGWVGSWPNVNSWLRSIAHPELTRPCFIEDYATYTRPTRVLAKNYVLGRRNAVMDTDVLPGREGTFTFHAGRNFSTVPGVLARDIDFLLDRGDTLMLSVFNEDSLEATPMYFRVNQVTRERIGRDGHSYYNQSTGEMELVSYATLKYSIDFVEVDRPETGTILVSQYSWQTVKDANTAWQTVKDSHSDWLDVLARPTL